ncbi:universal stress protein [Desulfovibrio inopinatus]|uniref:universal stress protein n=1 Tax=Desulfovibrio inopinatus TaxID=102109 RepID=UPI00041A9414|nr:universal stress protein [Desulfovibrio inopinatus]
MKKIIVGVDGSELSEKALHRVIHEAQCSPCEIIVVSVAESLSVLSLERNESAGSAWEKLLAEPRKTMEEACQLMDENGASCHGVVEAGRPAEVISRVARQEQADEIIIGSQGKHAVDRLLLGSVSARLVEIAPCTVVVVR